ncbi:efflux transporter outer membrane subunit [Verticiella sediminum]|nr:efflux transporter outer membrane subunit [Verticiella sediminum]
MTVRRDCGRAARGCRRMRGLAVLAVSAALAACAIEPVTPAVPDMPERFRHAGPWREAAPAMPQTGGATWAVLADDELLRSLTSVAANNQDLAQAQARHRQAVAAANGARATLWPRVDASAAASRSGGGAEAAARRYVAGLDLAWTPDVWGRAGAEADAAQFDVRAQQAAVGGARLLVEAEYARQYLRIRVLDAQTRMLRATEEAYARSLALTRNQYDVGLVARSDVLLAETQLAAVRVQLREQESARAALEHALAVLLGLAPADFRLAPVADVPAPPSVPAGLPSALLERRPDVVQAADDAHAANLRVGVAQRAWFPDFTLQASGGWQSATLGQWLSAPARVWSIGPALAATLFDGGARAAGLERAQAVADEAAARYRQRVLAAMQEVEDALAAIVTLDDVIARQEEVVALAAEAERLMRNQYAAGMVSFLDVAVAQNTTLAARRDLLDRVGARLDATVALIAATGGGWERGL